MENHQGFDILRRRAETCQDGESAVQIFNDLLKFRHDYFGRELCNSLNIPYRDDAPAYEILNEAGIDLDIETEKIPTCTPDNYFIRHGIMYIIDYKVTINPDLPSENYQKYMNHFEPIFQKHNKDFKVVVIHANPAAGTISVYPPSEIDTFNFRNLEINFNGYYTVDQILNEKFSDDEIFRNKIGTGDFSITSSWCDSDTPELWDHPVMKGFLDSLPDDKKDLFMKSVEINPEKQFWKNNLEEVIDSTKHKYNSFIDQEARRVFTVDKNNVQIPTKDKILRGWDSMYTGCQERFHMTTDIAKQKPSIHFTWAPHDPKLNNNNIPKVLFLADQLSSIDNASYSSTAQVREYIKQIGSLINFKNDVNGYVTHVTKLKEESRKHIRKNLLKPKPFMVDNCTATWEQQFKHDSTEQFKHVKQNFLKNFLGIGGHTQFSKEHASDIEQDQKVTILDFEDPGVILESKQMMSNTKRLLSKKSELKDTNSVLNSYMPKIQAASEETKLSIDKITQSRYWASINDYSVLMKNMLASAQYNKHNTFRVVTCANTNLFGLVFSGSDIKTRKSSLIYITIAFHKSSDDIVRFGANYDTYKCDYGYVTISKGMRLDKERCKRIVCAPGLFLQIALLMHNSNPYIDLDDVLTYAYFSSLSITKAMLSLTEPSRYMIMNSLALLSEVESYIREKFLPYAKTLFAVYIINKIKQGCLNANLQRDKIQLRNLCYDEIDITQKGVDDNRNLTSIWFPGMVSTKEYINQIYLPFYFNSKGLHEKHHVMIELAKVFLEIEKEQRQNTRNWWSESLEPQTINLDVYLHSISKQLLSDTARSSLLRTRIESRNNFMKSVTSISTMTSSKSCIKIGDFRHIKQVHLASRDKINKHQHVSKIACPDFLDEELTNQKYHHARYEDLKSVMKSGYTDYISKKVFDELYVKLKNNEITDKGFVEQAFRTMKEKTELYFTFFDKKQKTFVDREIYLGEIETKFMLYVVERIAKERCKLNPDEMISEPGDSKLRVLETSSNNQIKLLLKSSHDPGSNEKPMPPCKYEINADMTKWSAHDVMFKYFWMFVLDPILHSFEKKRILYFFCNYMRKKMILPDELLQTVLDQKFRRGEDILKEMTNGLTTNTVVIQQNWLQGNLNYTSSYAHSAAMRTLKDIITRAGELLDCKTYCSSMVHSDDNHTAVIMFQDKLDYVELGQFVFDAFARAAMAFGCTVNRKKTYINSMIKEFVSLFNIAGEPFSIYGRFLLTSVGDCAYIGPYEDLSSRLSATQTAIKHGCPPSLAWVSIAVNTWITYSTYNMLAGQANDPCIQLGIDNRFEIPVELGGFIDSDLSTIVLAGLESGNIDFVSKVSNKLSSPLLKNETIQAQAQAATWNLKNIKPSEEFRLKILRYLVLDADLVNDASVGETSDMRSRSLLTPRKFITRRQLLKLESYNDYREAVQNPEKLKTLQEYVLKHQEILVVKSENKENFMNSIIHRYFSPKFRESLSIQNPDQLFLEKVLFSKKADINYRRINDRYYIAPADDEEEGPCIKGNVTISEALRLIAQDLKDMPFTPTDLEIVVKHIILSDPFNVMVANTILTKITHGSVRRVALTAVSMPEFRSIKHITNSPALVIQAYLHGVNSVKTLDSTTLEADVYFLKTFIQDLNLEQKRDKAILLNEEKKGGKDLTFEIQENTRFLQICYDYIKSTSHKIKIFILPSKCFTATSFCETVLGNTMHDELFTHVNFIKPIISNTKKTEIATDYDFKTVLADECFRSLCYFIDTYLDQDYRTSYLYQIIETGIYKGYTLKDLFDRIRTTTRRLQFLPLLFHMGEMTDRDLRNYTIGRTETRVRWQEAQKHRGLNKGPFHLRLNNQNGNIVIVGLDDQITYVELVVPDGDMSKISMHARKVLDSRHGLNLHQFRILPEDSLTSGRYYLCFIATPRRMIYTIRESNDIRSRNKLQTQQQQANLQKINALCQVSIARRRAEPPITLERVRYLQKATCLSKIWISDDEVIVQRRGHLSKLTHIDNVNIQYAGLNLTKLMKTTSILNTNFETVSNMNIMFVVGIFECDNMQYSTDEITISLSDDIMDIDYEQVVETTPILKTKTSMKGRTGQTYKNAIANIIETGQKKLEQALQFDGHRKPNIMRKKNKFALETIVAVCRLMSMNNTTTYLDKCIHFIYFRLNRDSEYHLADLDKRFGDMSDPDWVKIIAMLEVFKSSTPESDWQQMIKEAFERLIQGCYEALEVKRRRANFTLWGDLQSSDEDDADIVIDI